MRNMMPETRAEVKRVAFYLFIESYPWLLEMRLLFDGSHWLTSIGGLFRIYVLCTDLSGDESARLTFGSVSIFLHPFSTVISIPIPSDIWWFQIERPMAALISKITLRARFP